MHCFSTIERQTMAADVNNKLLQFFADLKAGPNNKMKTTFLSHSYLFLP